MTSSGHILVVEDHPASREALSELLIDEGYTVDAVANAGDALQRGRSRRFDAAVVDYTLPDRTGVELLHELHAVDPALPVIVATGSASYEVTRAGHVQVDNHGNEACQAGAHHFMTKPIDSEELLRVLAGAVTSSQSTADR